MNQNDFFIYHPDKTTRLFYADYYNFLMENEDVYLVVESVAMRCIL